MLPGFAFRLPVTFQEARVRIEGVPEAVGPAAAVGLLIKPLAVRGEAGEGIIHQACGAWPLIVGSHYGAEQNRGPLVSSKSQ